MARRDRYAELIEYIAEKLYLCTEYEITPVAEVRAWSDIDSFTQAAYRNRAVRTIQALGLGFEWGVRTLEHVGDVDSAYASEEIARIVSEEMQDEDPETDARLVRRITGHWEEIEK